MNILLMKKTKRTWRTGPQPDREADKLVYNLRKEGKTFGQIAKLVKSDKGFIFRRYKRHVAELSTGNVDRL